MSEQKYWFVETEDGKRMAGPYNTNFEANQARVGIERAMWPETFWIRDEGWIKRATETIDAALADYLTRGEDE